jgi:hypothetical protein
MIRHRQGDSFLLITQHDHALMAGKFAEKIGNAMFTPPSPYLQAIDGIAMHDSGWPLHDDAPTINVKGEPLHVLEIGMELAVRVWSESAKRAAEKDPYTGLLVSLHVTALSNYAKMPPGPVPHERAENPAELFMLNKFQQKQFEHQENLRRELKMRTDLPLEDGLADAGEDPAEDLLRFNFGLLRLMDRLSLDICCSEDLFEEVEDTVPHPGELPVMIEFRHVGEGAMELTPWPFAVERIAVEIPCKRVPAKRYASDAELRAVYAAATPEMFKVQVAAF